MSRQRIVENINLSPETYFKRNEPLNESTITVEESGSTTSYNALAVYTFPISRPDQKNLNNRVYPSKLWENQILKKRGEGAFGLMDHPSGDSDGSTKDIWCVWRNLRFSQDKKLILADAYLFGFWGKQVLEALEAGGRVGLSSSGWGEFLDDNTTLNSETYELERPADFVLNPSYEVFGTEEDLIETMKKEQTNPADSNRLTEETTLEISPKENTEEKTMTEDTKKTSPSLEERNFELNMKSMFKEAKKITDLPKRIEESSNLLGYFGDNESPLREEIEASIKADKEQILEGYNKYLELSAKEEENKKTLEEAESIKKEAEELRKDKATLTEKISALEKEKESLNEEFGNACTLLDSMKEYDEKREELLKIAKAEKNSRVTASEYKELLVYSEDLENENKKLKKTVSELRRKLYSFIEAEDEDDEDEDDDEDEKGDDKKGKDKDSKAPEKSDDSEKKTDDEKEESYSIYKGVNPDVLSYYEDLEYMNPRVVKIKEEILSKHTIMEAQKTYYKLRSYVEEADTKLYTSGAKKYVESTKKSGPVHEGWL